MKVLRLQNILWSNLLISLLLLMLLISPQASAEKIALANTAQGEVYFIVFKDGLTAGGVAVYHQDKLKGKTHEDGSLLIWLPVGEQHLQLKKQGLGLTFLKLNIKEGDTIELLVPMIGQATATELVKIGEIIVESRQEDPLLTNINAEVVAEVDAEKLAEVVEEKPQASAVLAGQVTSFETKEGVPNVSIYIAGVSEKIITDLDGFFSIKLTPGKYTFSTIHADYSSQTIKHLELAENIKLTQNIELTPAVEQLAEFVVIAPALEGGILAMMVARKNSTTVTEVLSSEEMSSAGDSTAGDALKRVTGITTVGGRYVYVRGMGDRYSLTLLNKASLPSPDPSKKVVPLDLFPTSMIGSITVQKSYSADLPGDFGGGAVLLKTKTIPTERKRKIQFSLGGNTQSTGKEGLGYQGGSIDFLGIDDGTREIPKEVQQFLDNPPGRFDADRADRINQAGRSLPNIYQLSRKTLLPDASFQVDLANVREQHGQNWAWGYNVSFGYKRKARFLTEYGQDNQNSDPSINDVDNKKAKTRQTVTTFGMLNFMLELGNYSKLDSTTILSRITNDTVTVADVYNPESTSNFRNYTLSWEERQLFSQQFHGIHVFPAAGDLEIEWQTTFSNAQRKAPDTRFYQYGQNAYILPEINNPYLFQTVGDSNSRVWEDLNDNALSLSVDFNKPLYDFFGALGSWNSGLAYDAKDRTSDVYRTRWNIPNNTNADLSNPNPEGFLNNNYIGGTSSSIQLQDYTASTDSYQANQSIVAIYSKISNKWPSGLSFMAGARYEDSTQIVETVLTEASGEKTTTDLSRGFVLPSISLGYEISPALGQVRFAYAQTINRPELKELSEARYFNPIDDRYYVGNPNLQIAEITHLDLRWEKYLSSFENMSVAIFSKNFINPIELTQEPGGGTVDSFTYNNVASATNQGIELQGRIWLRRIFGTAARAFYLDANASFIESNVDLSDAFNYVGTNKNRALQGQSPWVFNANLGYENLVKDIKANLTLNMVGPSIVGVGINGENDTYLVSPIALNFVYSQRLYEGHEDKWKLKIKLNNILDGEFKHTVGKSGSTVKKRYRKGTSISAEVSYSWK